jgi:hypothetical protein
MCPPLGTRKLWGTFEGMWNHVTGPDRMTLPALDPSADRLDRLHCPLWCRGPDGRRLRHQAVLPEGLSA